MASGTYAFAVEGLADLEGLESLAPEIELAASRAINATARKGRTLAVRRIRDQVNLPAGYFQGDNSRLRVSAFASAGNLTAEITGRQRPTSLARFVVGARTAGTRNPSVAVKPGRTSRMGRSFLIKLRGGANGDNLGLAVRTEAGRRPSGAYRPTKISENLWLVYGPSVDQVFRSVREDIGPELATYLRGEFSRLLEVRR